MSTYIQFMCCFSLLFYFHFFCHFIFSASSIHLHAIPLRRFGCFLIVAGTLKGEKKYLSLLLPPSLPPPVPVAIVLFNRRRRLAGWLHCDGMAQHQFDFHSQSWHRMFVITYNKRLKLFLKRKTCAINVPILFFCQSGLKYHMAARLILHIGSTNFVTQR